jgi:hypothetical protein
MGKYAPFAERASAHDQRDAESAWLARPSVPSSRERAVGLPRTAWGRALGGPLARAARRARQAVTRRSAAGQPQRSMKKITTPVTETYSQIGKNTRFRRRWRTNERVKAK